MTPDLDDRYADLQTVAAVARDADLPRLEADATMLGERLSAGRFFVACVGQFKRGKSTVLNALVGDSVLPVGVTPVTSAVTILRYATERRATVFYTAGRRQPIPVEDVALYVAEEHNHENQRGVAAVEVFLPAPLLERGLCLVDTPGIGSVFTGNTEATRAFVPHIDAALVVLGADPPISADELSLVLEVLKQAPRSIMVLNKADRISANDMRQAREFTERLVGDRLGRPIGPVLEVSATERLERRIPTRDWQRLEDALASLSRDAGEILTRSHHRGIARLIKQLRDDLDERRGALLRPIHESEARIEILRRSVAEAETMLRELGILLAAEQRRMLAAFQQGQAEFLKGEVTAATNELHAWIDQLPSAHLADRSKAFEHASAITQSRIEGWLPRIEPGADALYRDATLRFTSFANQFLKRLTESPDAAFANLPPSLDPEVGIREGRHFYATDLMHLTAPGLLNRITDLLTPRAARRARIMRDASAYLDRLLSTNTTRVVFDLDQRVEASRRKLESELRFLLQNITGSAERALERARVRQQVGQEAVIGELAKLDVLRQRLDRVTLHATLE
jgi:GTP-binding protein EngB required for normal cell division